MPENPFEITKAVDFTDAQIASTWVDLPGGGFTSLADPKSPMPMFLVGGKGGGRTHLLRYFSFALQTLRAGGEPLQIVREDGYVGIYFRCAGLNSSRFAGKRQDEETWAAVFAYYTELWLARLTLDIVAQVVRDSPECFPTADLEDLAESIGQLFDDPIAADFKGHLDPLASLLEILGNKQREMDRAINNAALSHELPIRIEANPGRLVFGVPRAISDHLRAFEGVAFAYLIDEYENLSLDQQRYVNTLVREKELPTTILIGSRLYGIRTHQTLAAGEENRQGSEFDQVVLEDAYRIQAHKYETFCDEIVHRRLEAAGLDFSQVNILKAMFELPAGGARTLEERARFHVAEKSLESGDRPWIIRLRRQLESAGIEPDPILARVQVEDDPLLEKYGILRLYRGWADRHDLDKTSEGVAQMLQDLAPPRTARGNRAAVSYKHYHGDLYAQILNDLKLPQEYFGLADFVLMSGYLPRNLLVVLKQVTKWSAFRGEDPFRGGQVSVRSQREGVSEASTWFLTDSKGLGRIGEETQSSIRRLGAIFREMRFADKPVEVSCAAFSTDRNGMTTGALECLDEAISHSLILEIPRGRKEKNSHVLLHKYQLNPMLAPLFDLPIARRGAADFGPDLLNAIFDPEGSLSFDRARRSVLGRLNAPFSRGDLQDALGFE